MGAWDTGSFDNDTALDWVSDLVGSEDLEPVESALTAATAPSGALLDADVSSEALAAAEVVAALMGNPHAELPDEVQAWVADRRVVVPASLADLARRAVDQVGRASELKDLWAEGEDEQWPAAVAELRARLGA